MAITTISILKSILRKTSRCSPNDKSPLFSAGSLIITSFLFRLTAHLLINTSLYFFLDPTVHFFFCWFVHPFFKAFYAFAHAFHEFREFFTSKNK